jgi:hypothetical protein
VDDTRLTISEEDQLRALYGEPGDLVRRKELPTLDGHCRAFIAASPFLVIATADAKGRADASPRGDGPGFVAIVDERTLLIPDRPGNKRLDSLRNVLENPNVGLIFFVPGMNETLRVNGRAELITDRALLEPLAVGGKVPLSGIVVRIEEAYLHCAKALIRSKLWDPAVQIDRKIFPTLGQMIADQIDGIDADAADADIEDAYTKRLY